MDDILFQCRAMAAIPIAAIPMKSIIIAMATIQSTSPIDKAIWLNKWALVGYIATLFVVALMTFLSWWAGSHLQDVIQRDADARIAEADGKAATANENAGKANERAQKLEGDNLILRGQVATLETQAADAKKDVAGLQKAAADAKAAQQRVEIDLSNAVAQQQSIQTELARQQERAAKAERVLEAERRERLRLEEAIAPRNIVSLFVMVDALQKFAGKKAIVEYLDEDEPSRLAHDVSSVLSMAGWKVEKQPTSVVLGVKNISVWVPIVNPPSKELDSTVAATNVLVEHLRADRLEVGAFPTTVLPADTIRISVGRRESTHLARKRFEEVYRDFIFGEPNDPILEPLREQAQYSHFTEEKRRLFVSNVERLEGATPCTT